MVILQHNVSLAALDEWCQTNCSLVVGAICRTVSLSPLSLSHNTSANNNNTNSLSQAEAYGYGFIMIAVISLLSLMGVVIVPCIRGNSRLVICYKHLITLLISMGVAALVTDALVHLIPNAIGIHSHKGSNSDTHTHKGVNEEDVVWKMCAVLAGAVSFFLLELLLHSCSSRFGHTHSHTVETVLENSASSLDSEALLGDRQANSSAVGDEGYPHSQPETPQVDKPHPQLPRPQYGAVGSSDGDGVLNHQTQGGCLTPVTSIKPLAWVIIVGDGMHNLTDGLAVGVAISQSLGLGLSTGIAILFHEIPHELSDYAILLHTGMSWYKALFLNFASTLTAIVGFFVGVAIGTDSEESNEWLLAVIAGQFLYIALVDLLPEVLHSKEKGLQKVVQVLMTFLGLMIGFSILLTIALFEDRLNVSIH